jgi:hypothetical protein
MRLSPEQQAMNVEIASMARNLGWAVYMQSTRNQNQGMPSIVCVKPNKILMAFIRSGRLREDRLPVMDLWDQFGGVEVKLWHLPGDKSLARADLTVD